MDVFMLAFRLYRRGSYIILAEFFSFTLAVPTSGVNHVLGPSLGPSRHMLCARHTLDAM